METTRPARCPSRHPDRRGDPTALRSGASLRSRSLRSSGRLFLAAVVLAVSAARVSAVQPGPDKPNTPYWFRNVTGRVVETGLMDPKLQQVADAFGVGDYDKCRRLAQALLHSTDDPTLRSEATAFVIQSLLAEGDFDGARAEVKRLNDEASLARIKKLKADYLAEVGRLQRIVAGATDVGEAAEAQLLTAHAHQRAGIVGLALESYWKVIDRYPQQTEAEQAVAQVGSLLMGRRDYARALTHMKAVIRGYPKTRAAARAQLSIGNIHRVQGDREEEEAALLTAARSYRGDPAANAARDTLAVMYYARGAEALARNDTLSALESYRKGVHVDADRDRKAKRALHVADLYSELQRWAEARAAANEVLKLDPPDKRQFILRRRRARDVIADTYYRQGRYAEALARYAELLVESTSQPQELLVGSTSEPVERGMYESTIVRIVLEMYADASPDEASIEPEEVQEDAR